MYHMQFLQEWAQAEAILMDLLAENSNDTEALRMLVQNYYWSQQYDKAIGVMEDWVMRHPGDSTAKQDLERLKVMAAQDSATAGSQP